MKKRFPAFDYIRTIAIIGILVCHFLYNWDYSSQIGRFLGCTFNVVFLCMSGLLLGISWHKQKKPNYGRAFLHRRFTRLMTSYYPFVVIMCLFLMFVADFPLRIFDLCMHLAFLPWFDKLPGFEHLWFLTMIVLCYVAAMVTSRIKHISLWFEVLLLFAASFVHWTALKYGLPGQMFSYLAIFLLTFRYAPNFIAFAQRISLPLMTIFSVVILSSSIYAYANGLYDNQRFLAEWSGILCAYTIKILLLRLMKGANSCKIVDYIASISFEIYLLHHVISFGPYSVVRIIPHPIVAFVALIIVTFILASALHWCSSKLSKIIC